jgi:hypothetical protein
VELSRQGSCHLWSKAYGGGISAVTAPAFTTTGSTLASNRVIFSQYFGAGGGVYLCQSTTPVVRIVRSSLRGNSLNSTGSNAGAASGGGIELDSPSVPATIDIRDSAFTRNAIIVASTTSNWPTISGSAVCWEGTLRITRTNVTLNRVQVRGSTLWMHSLCMQHQVVGCASLAAIHGKSSFCVGTGGYVYCRGG